MLREEAIPVEYTVTWTIELEAESIEDAAQKALEIQRDPDSLATHFIVTDCFGNTREVAEGRIGP